MKKTFVIFNLILILIGLTLISPSIVFADYTFKSPEAEENRIINNKKMHLKTKYNDPIYDIKVGQPLTKNPGYKYEVEYIINNKCEAKAIIPYRGITYYSCPSGHMFWSSVLAPIPSLPLSYYTTKKHKDGQDASDAAMLSSVNAVIFY